MGGGWREGRGEGGHGEGVEEWGERKGTSGGWWE